MSYGIAAKTKEKMRVGRLVVDAAKPKLLRTSFLVKTRPVRMAFILCAKNVEIKPIKKKLLGKRN